MRKRGCASSSEIRDQEGGRSSNGCVDRTAGFFDLLTSGSTGVLHDEVECLGDFANAKNLDLVATAVDQTLATECGFVDGGSGVEKIVEFTHVEDTEFVAEVVVVETALGKAAVKRHLATFETDTSAGTGAGLLALVAFAGGLAVTGAFAATKALDLVL